MRRSWRYWVSESVSAAGGAESKRCWLLQIILITKAGWLYISAGIFVICPSCTPGSINMSEFVRVCRLNRGNVYKYLRIRKEGKSTIKVTMKYSLALKSFLLSG